MRRYEIAVLLGIGLAAAVRWHSDHRAKIELIPNEHIPYNPTWCAGDCK